MNTPGKKLKPRRVNVRKPDVMELVKAEVEDHYHSEVVEKIKAEKNVLKVGDTTVYLAQQFGFCYGVERAIDLAYASRKVFPDARIFLIGEIIHNPEVNRQLTEMGIVSLAWKTLDAEYDDLGPDDVVLVPAFGASTEFMDKLDQQGCNIVDTTCGDVMKVWRRVRGYAKAGITSIIHGKAGHEETRATASRALGEDKTGQYLVVLTLDDVDYVTDYLKNGGDRAAFLERFEGCHSIGFDPDLHLKQVGVANQTTMLKSETEELQKRVGIAVEERDGHRENFQAFDTICGATQERQDALFGLLREKMDLLLVVGGYNSSNTTHLVEIGNEHLPTFFIRTADCLKSVEEVLHFDLESKTETTSYTNLLDPKTPAIVGITAGASCPNNLIEDTILKVYGLRGVDRAEVLAS